MLRIEFTEDDLDQFPPEVQQALLRLSDQQEAIRKPVPSGNFVAPGLKVVEHKTADDLAKEWQSHYKGGAIHHDPQPEG